jgi:hypothetical protein
MTCLGGVLVGLPLLNSAALDRGRGTASAFIGGMIVVLALTVREQPHHWQCWTEFFPGFAIVLLPIFTGQWLTECHWPSLAGVTILATFADDFPVAQDERDSYDKPTRSVKSLFRLSVNGGGLLGSARLLGRDKYSARREALYSLRRDGSREWIWSALGIPPGRLLKPISSSGG